MTGRQPSGVVFLPMKDAAAAKSCYEDLGWQLEADVTEDGYRVLQFTPPSSDVTIVFLGPTADEARSEPPIAAWALESPETAWFWARGT